MQNNLYISSFNVLVKRIFSIILLVCITGVLFKQYLQVSAYPRNDSVYEYYRFIPKDTIDCLFVGSSHIYCSINPIQMFNDYGISAYNLTGGGQSIWSSFFYIKEALKAQKPKIVLIDCYTLTEEDSYYNQKRIINNLLPLKPSLVKWQAIEATDAEDKMDIFLQFPITHSRYNLLDQKFYDKNYIGNLNFLGFEYNAKSAETDVNSLIEAEKVKGIIPISEKAENYLRKCIELCKKNNIDIILLNAPYPEITENDQKKYNYVKQLAAEYQIPFLNACVATKEIGLNYAVDTIGDGSHLNYGGATKYTEWVSYYLKRNYDLPDRRGDKTYKIWEYQTERLNAVMRKEELASTDDFRQYLNIIQQEKSLYYVISLNGDYSKGEREILKELESRGINITQSGTYIMNEARVIFYSNGKNDYNYYQYFGDSVLNVYREKENHIIRWNNDGFYNIVDNGINILVYDEMINEKVGIIAFNADNDYELVRWQ